MEAELTLKGWGRPQGGQPTGRGELNLEDGMGRGGVEGGQRGDRTGQAGDRGETRLETGPAPEGAEILASAPFPGLARSGSEWRAVMRGLITSGHFL